MAYTNTNTLGNISQDPPVVSELKSIFNVLPDDELLEELQAPTYEIVNGKIRVMKKDTMREVLKRSPDRADALCLTFATPDLLFPYL